MCKLIVRVNYLFAIFYTFAKTELSGNLIVDVGGKNKQNKVPFIKFQPDLLNDLQN